jgi:hypothetical protein
MAVSEEQGVQPGILSLFTHVPTVIAAVDTVLAKGVTAQGFAL